MASSTESPPPPAKGKKRCSGFEALVTAKLSSWRTRRRFGKRYTVCAKSAKQLAPSFHFLLFSSRIELRFVLLPGIQNGRADVHAEVGDVQTLLGLQNATETGGSLCVSARPHWCVMVGFFVA